MTRLKQKKDKKGSLITILILLVIMAVVVVLENTISPNSMIFTVLKKFQ